MLSLKIMIRGLSAIFALLTTPAFAQTATQGNTNPTTQHSPMAETPNTDIYYRLAPDALVRDGVPKGAIRGPFTLPSQAYPASSIRTRSMYRRSTARPRPPV
jgi:enterochelin esterase family protein